MANETQTASHNQQPTDHAINGEVFAAQFENVPQDLQPKVQEVGAAIDTAIEGIDHPTAEQQTTVSERYADVKTAGLNTLQTNLPRLVEDGFSYVGTGTFNPLSGSQISGYVHRKLGIPRVGHDELPSDSAERKKVREVSARIDGYSRHAPHQLEQQFKDRAANEVRYTVEMAQAAVPAEAEAVVPEVCHDLAEDRLAGVKRAVDDAPRLIDRHLETLDPENQKLRGLGSISMRARSDRKANVAYATQQVQARLTEVEDLAKRAGDVDTPDFERAARNAANHSVKDVEDAVKAVISKHRGAFIDAAESGVLHDKFTDAVIAELRAAGFTVGHQDPVEASRPRVRTNTPELDAAVEREIAQLAQGGMTEKEIKRELSRRWHPDGESDDPDAEAKLQYLNIRTARSQEAIAPPEGTTSS